MKYSEAEPGRVFVMRLEHGDVIHETIEETNTAAQQINLSTKQQQSASEQLAEAMKDSVPDPEDAMTE